MREREPANVDVAVHLEQDMVPVEAATIDSLVDLIDHMIESAPQGLSCSAEADRVSEWYEVSTVIADMDNVATPFTQLRMSLRRTDERPLAETYMVILDWSVLGRELEDPGYLRAFRLTRPYDREVDGPTLNVCFQYSAVHSYVDNDIRDIKSYPSGHHEADRQINRNFGKWNPCRKYEAEQLLTELAFLSSSSNRDAH